MIGASHSTVHRVLVAPYAFKGTMTAREAAQAIAEGVTAAMPGVETWLLPLGDGGSGTLDTLMSVHGGTYRSARCHDARGDLRECRWGMTVDGMAVVEAAQVLALADVPENRRDPSVLRTTGLGELVRIAFDASPRKLTIGLGDTATHDCGLGAGSVLGYRFLDRHGDELPPVGHSLPDLAAIDASHAFPLPAIPGRLVFCDVVNPLLGPDGAAFRFAGQKGADDVMIARLEEGGWRFAEVVRRDLGVNVAVVPGAGAAGGLGAGLRAFLGADLVPGADGVLEAASFDALAASCDLVVTGEGMLDAKTLLGKGVRRAVTRARRAHARVLVVVGRVEGERRYWEERLDASVVELGAGDSGASHTEHLATAVRRWLGVG